MYAGQRPSHMALSGLRRRLHLVSVERQAGGGLQREEGGAPQPGLMALLPGFHVGRIINCSDLSHLLLHGAQILCLRCFCSSQFMLRPHSSSLGMGRLENGSGKLGLCEWLRPQKRASMPFVYRTQPLRTIYQGEHMTSQPPAPGSRTSHP